MGVAPPGRILSGGHATTTFLRASGPTRPDPDACERARAFLEDLVDSADVILSRRPDLTVEMESDLTDLSMQNAYLVGHALKILLGLGVGSSGKTRSDAVLRIRLKCRLSGRVELSVTDDGTYFPTDMGVASAADRDLRELVAFVTGRGGSVLVTRLVAAEVAVVIWNRPPIGLSPRVDA
ncbi:MAG: hypothetical protein GYA47_05740 [Desulfovibrio sp.]|nr:hypothetical protein [Desulfovibrio sp.]